MARPQMACLGGMALRTDHGCKYQLDHFTNQIKFCGIQPSYAFVADAQTIGVAERFNLTLKELIIHVSHLPQHRGAAGRRPQLRRSSIICSVDRRKERLPASPAEEFRFRRGTPQSQSDAPRPTNSCPKHKAALEYMGELYLETDRRAKAEELLATLEKLCPQGCEELDDLRQAIEGS